jgi:phospholipid-binding lipoprotein MlaA
MIVAMLFVAGCAGTQDTNGASGSPQSAVREAEIKPIPDPLEPVNRAVFQFNDRLYFWVIKRTAQGYKFVMPKIARRGVSNFFSNLAMPIRAVNCLLQADVKRTGVELGRFGVNTTVGVLGFGDPATGWGLRRQREDFGQTLGTYGMGPIIYIVWPVFGPSSVRGTARLVGDSFLHPLKYYPPSTAARIGIKAYDRLNEASLRIGQYESIKEGALDPYVAFRNGFHQHRQHLVRQHGRAEGKQGKKEP